jgi:hypothetical protein
MDQLAENRQRAGPGLFQRQRNGVLHSETHAKMFCSNNFHKRLWMERRSPTRHEKDGKHQRAGPETGAPLPID